MSWKRFFFCLILAGVLLFDVNLGSASFLIPEGMETIESEAFQSCVSLNDIQIPASVSEIGEGAFSDCGEALWIHCTPGSAAQYYAIQHQLDYDAGTVYRALLIGQTYSGTNLVLYGPANDVKAMRFCLLEYDQTKYSVTVKTNLTGSAILQAVASAFSSVTENDVSLFYYSGHGNTDGSLVGSDESTISPAQLKTALDQIPGRKVVIVDACYSGQLISEENSLLLSNSNPVGSAPDPSSFTSAWMSVFSNRLRGVFNTGSGSYFVMTAAQPDEESQEGSISSGTSQRIMGLFSHGLCLGCGYDGITYRATSLQADRNGDSAVSIQEAFSFANQKVHENSGTQSAMVWPAGCTWFAPFRK